MNDLSASPPQQVGRDAAHAQTLTASPANLMAQLEELNSLAGRVQTQTEVHRADRWVEARPAGRSRPARAQV